MTKWHVWLCVVALLVAVPAALLASSSVRRRLNPVNTSAAVSSRLYVLTTGSSCLNLPIKTADPSTPQAGEFWCVDSGSRHQCCFSDGSTTYCRDYAAQ